MPGLPAVLLPDALLLELLISQAARQGGAIRRKARDAGRHVGREAFLAEARRRGVTVLGNAGQLVILCNREPVRRLA